MRHIEMKEPERIAKLPHYKGLPVTFITFISSDGIPNFKATNENVWVSKRDGLCSICGEKLDYWVAFMVDETESKTREVYENPNHEECLKYAFNICPWLYYSKAKYSDLSKNYDLGDGYIAVDAHPNRQVSSERPQKLGIYITNRYENIIKKNKLGGGGYRICKVAKAKRIEWIEGH